MRGDGASASGANGGGGGGVRRSRGSRGPDGQWASHLHFGPGLALEMTAPAFLELYEIPGRGGSDWTIQRGGAVFLETARSVRY